MTLHIAIWRHDTHVNGPLWAGQVMRNGQPAQLKTAVNTADMGCSHVWHGEMSDLIEKLLKDWRAAEAYAG